MLTSIPDDFLRRSIAVALYRLLVQGSQYFITDVRDALELAGQEAKGPAFQAVRLHNGARYDAMPRGFHGELACRTLALFQGHAVTGDSFLKDLAEAAVYRKEDAPTVQDLDLRHSGLHRGDGQAMVEPVLAPSNEPGAQP